MGAIKRIQSRGDSFLTDKGKRILIPVVAILMLYLITYIMNPFSQYWHDYFNRGLGYLIADWTLSFMFCLCVSEASIFIGRKLNTSISWTDHPRVRLGMESGLNFVVILLLLFLLGMLYLYIGEGDTQSVLNASSPAEATRGVFQWFLVSFVIAFMIITINTVDFMIANWKNAALRAAESSQLAMEAELQSLKLQLDPHFVFNNLSVLSELILEDQQLGYEYAENFAKIYRYLLVHAKKDLIELEEEIKFLHAYIFLLEQRIGDGVHFNIDIDFDCFNRQLPPLTIQMLVENALKHNKTVKRNPLVISIYCKEKKVLIVENTFNPLELKAPSSGLGIKNIIRRYGLISGAKPEIYNDEKIYRVTVPLLS